ncbi:MAG: Nisin biosynthesis protein NisB [Chlamydiae bacterium]|nr:Nisin biosynthesis protein NisB [Chlamydiota bacterium]
MANQEDPLFQEAPFFLLRTPFLPIEEFHALVDSQDPGAHLLELFQTRPSIREAVAVASSSLYQALCNFDQLDDKRKKQAISSLFKYVLRMATRATPFGLFSFVSLGKWGDHTQMNIDLKKVSKRARPDMDWVIHFLDQIASDEAAFLSLKLKKNPLLFENMDRLVLSYTRRDKGKNEQLSIRASPLVRFIIDKTENALSVNELIQEVLQDNPSLDASKVLEVIRSLMEKEILFPSFFPSLLTDCPLTDALEELKSVSPKPALIDQLQETYEKVRSFNTTSLGEGELSFVEIESSMKNDSVTRPLQVDSFYPDQVILSKTIATQLRGAVEALWKLSTAKKGLDHLRSYHMNFLEKYGLARTVPLLELVDEVKGLGFPEIYTNPAAASDNREKSPNLESSLLQEWVKCFHEKKGEIIIDDAFVKRHQHDSPKADAPTSFDLYCEVIADSQESIENEDFLIYVHPVTGAGDGCSTFGRFLDLFKETGKEQVRHFFDTEEALEENVIFVECSFFPSSPRSANVSIHSDLRKNVLDLGYPKDTTKHLSIRDIYVGATESYLYLTFKEGKKELSIVAMNALNPDLAPHIVRLVRDISKDRCQSLGRLDWGKGELLPFRPRVRYKKTIFSPATWLLTLSLINADKKDSQELIIQKIKDWANEWNLPRFLLMTMADNRVLLDRTQIFHLKEIAHQLKTNSDRPVMLVEKIGSQEWVRTNLGTHFSEFVIPFVKNKKYVPKSFKILPFSPVNTKARFKLPGSEWLYAKLYLPQKNESRFLVQPVYSLVQELLPSLDSWFYIRYTDEKKSHIRLRLKPKEKESQNLLQNLYSWSDYFIQQGWMRDFCIATYEKEIERYGGEEIMELAEEVFCADSELTLSIIQTILSKQFDLPDYIICALSLIEIVKGFGLSLEDQLLFFSEMNLGKSQLKGFREWKAKLIPLIDSAFSEEIPHYQGEPLFSQPLLHKRIVILQEYRAQIDSKALEKEKILASLLHMHCNRVFGTDHLLEQKAHVYAHQMLQVFSKLSINSKFA